MRSTRKRAGRDIVSKKGGAKKTSSPIYEGGKMISRRKRGGRDIVSKKGEIEKNLLPNYCKGKK